MRGKEQRDLAAQLEAINSLVDKIDRNVERIELATVIREPNTKLAVDAYDGLRKQVVAGASERAAHLHQLAEFDSALERGATLEDLKTLVGEWLGQAGVQVVTDPSVEGAFELVGDRSGDVRVHQPAYVEASTGRLVRRGLAETVTLDPKLAGNGSADVAAHDSAPSAPEPETAVDEGRQ